MRGSEVCVDGLKSGSPIAWRSFVNEYAGVLRHYARRMGHSDPDDVVGATMETAARLVHDFDGGAAEFRSLIFTVAHARIIDDSRRRVHRKTSAVGTEIALHAEAMSPSVHPLSDDVRLMLLCLPADQRNIVTMRFIQGFSNAEIAVATGRSEVAVRVAVSRALVRLRDQVTLPRATITRGERRVPQ